MDARAGTLSDERRVLFRRPDQHPGVVAARGPSEQRKPLLPAQLVVPFVLARVPFSPVPYLDVMRQLVAGLRGPGLLGEWRVPGKQSPFRTQQRLGSKPLRMLFATTVKPMATETTQGAFRRGLRVLTVGGPIEDISVEWNEDAAPLVKAAALTISSQDFRTAGRNDLSEELSFSIAHSLVEHRPLGSIARACMRAYGEIADWRQARDHRARSF
ncbi:transposase domain-containing protein [Streptomyces sp. STR69]|uniref:transposase domain-containing protein n=1 Tax=Streptomyces sp. STR69 TaxID=1796942 RepID=UPI0021C6CAA7|nr:transposase domain-containing protein [Streptomyces sp. STR69]